jgi:hypothetical protein
MLVQPTNIVVALVLPPPPQYLNSEAKAQALSIAQALNQDSIRNNGSAVVVVVVVVVVVAI